MRLREALDPWTAKKLFWFILKPFMTCVLKLHGVQSRKTKAYGYPRVHNEGEIVLGEGVQLFSTNAYYVTAGFLPNCLLTTYKGGRIVIGKSAQLHGATVISAEEVSIGERTLVGANATIMDTDLHTINPKHRHEPFSDRVARKRVRIGKNVWIGLNVTILKGVEIGDNAVIGAGSVVTKDVPANCIAAGNPARVLRKIEKDG